MSELHVLYTSTGWETSSIISGELKEKVEDLNLDDVLDIVNGYDYATDEALVISVGHLRYMLESIMYKAKEQEFLKSNRSDR